MMVTTGKTWRSQGEKKAICAPPMLDWNLCDRYHVHGPKIELDHRALSFDSI